MSGVQITDMIGRIGMSCLCVLARPWVMEILGCYSINFSHVLYSFLTIFLNLSRRWLRKPLATLWKCSDELHSLALPVQTFTDKTHQAHVHWKESSPFPSYSFGHFSLIPMHCGTDSRVVTSMIVTNFTFLSLGSTFIFPTYSHNLRFLVTPLTFKQQPNLVNFCFEGLLSLVLCEQLVNHFLLIIRVGHDHKVTEYHAKIARLYGQPTTRRTGILVWPIMTINRNDLSNSS